MKKVLIFICLAIFFADSALAQSQEFVYTRVVDKYAREVLHTCGSSENINDVSVFEDTIIYAVGNLLVVTRLETTTHAYVSLVMERKLDIEPLNSIHA